MDKKKLALIHIVKKELNLTDQEYRDILRKSAGVESAKELDDKKFRKLMNIFMRSKYYRTHPEGISLRQKHFIKNLVEEINWDEKHLNNFLKKYYRKENLNQLTKTAASKLIASLKHIKDHQKRAP